VIVVTEFEAKTVQVQASV